MYSRFKSAFIYASMYYYLVTLAYFVQEFVGKLGTGTIFVAMIAINHRRRFEVR